VTHGLRMLRNQGEEFHRNNASELTDYLYLAACRACTSKCLLDLKITSIVNATLELPTVAYQKQDTIQIAVEDKVGAKLNIYFDLIADKINQVHLSGGKILIYCRAGQSRSVTLCIAYFMKYHDMTFDQAFQFVRTKRPIIHPNRGFVHQLKQYEEKLQSKPVFAKPSISRDNSFKLASRLSFAENTAIEDPAFMDADGSWGAPLKPFRPSRSRVVVTLHEPLASVVDRHEVVVVDDCFESGPYKPPAVENPSVGMAETRGVVSCGVNPPTIGIVPDIEPLNARAKRRAAFTKLTKPNEIAVSILNIPCFLVIPSDSNIFKIQTKPEHCSSAIPDLLQAYAVAEEVLPECLGTVAKALNTSTTARTVICRGWEVAVSQWTFPLVWPAPCDTKSGLAGPTPAPEAAAYKPRTFIPTTNVSKYSTQSSRVTQPKLLQRHGSVRGSKRDAVPAPPVIKPESVTVSPVKALVKRCTEYRCCVTQLPAPILWEKEAVRAAGLDVSMKKTEKSVKVVRGCNSIAVSTSLAWQVVQPAPLLDIPIDSYHKLDFSFANFEVSQVASKSTAVFLGAESVEFGQTMTVIREFPYYSTVLLTSALDMSRAQEEAKLNVKWFKPNKPKTQRPDPVELIMKISEQKQEEQRRKVSQPQVKWGTERCLTDDFQMALAMTIRLPPACHAVCYKVMPVREHLTDTLPFIWLKTELLGKFYVPHYNPVMITRTMGPTIRPVVDSSLPVQMEMTNLYTTPRTAEASDKAKQAVHMDCLSVTTTYMPQINTDFECEEIPDEIHDIQEIKRVLAENGESNKCKIWFDVFKRTLMRKRPTYPKVSRSHFLPTATVSNCILQEFPSVLATHSFIPLRACCSSQPPPLQVATIREVKEIEKYSEFDQFIKPTLIPEKFTSGLVLLEEYLVVQGTGWAWESCDSLFPTTKELPALERAISTVSFPNRLYTVGEVEVQGITGEYSPTLYQKQARTAFTLLTKPRKAAQCHVPIRLGVATDLPEYQFVQDIEEQADELLHRNPTTSSAKWKKIDSFWFFAMETAKATETKNKLGSTPQGASKYQLFLPDSKMASKIGQENMFPDDSSEASNNSEQISVVNPKAVVAEVMAEIKDTKPPIPKVAPEVRVGRRGSQRVVSFKPEDEDEKRSKPKTIYYGRDRSKSRTRLKDVPKEAEKQQRGATAPSARQRRDKSTQRYNEAEVMKNLESSVNEANDILTRRRGRDMDKEMYSPVREVPTPLLSPYPDYRSPRLQTRSEERHARRSRDTELNRKETERYERNKKMMEDAKRVSKDAEQTAVVTEVVDRTQQLPASFGLLNFAQNIFTGRSRREQSKDRSRDLVRRTRKFM